jgi:hypothetical protein
MNDHLSQEYCAQFDHLLESLGTLSYKELLTGFWPLTGAKFRPERMLMVIGKAVNGWQAGWIAASMGDSRKRQQVIHRLRKHERNDLCSMSWLDRSREQGTYNSNLSAFWRLTRGVVELMGCTDADWHSHVAWSNLFKIAPCAGGNPSGQLRRTQIPQCIELLKQEVAELNPRVVLVVAGSDWFEPFAEGLRLQLQDTKSTRFVQQVSSRGKRRWIVGRHPQGKPEQAYLEEILNIMRIACLI